LKTKTDFEVFEGKLIGKWPEISLLQRKLLSINV